MKTLFLTSSKANLKAQICLTFLTKYWHFLVKYLTGPQKGILLFTNNNNKNLFQHDNKLFSSDNRKKLILVARPISVYVTTK